MMRTYPDLSGAEQWRLLCWMMRHPRALHEDTMAAPVAQNAPTQERRRKGLHALLAHLPRLAGT